MLCFHLFVLPGEDRGVAAAWSPIRRLLVLAGTAALAIALLTPMFLETRQYGPRLGEADIASYPELGPSGRYVKSDRPPYRNVFSASYRAYRKVFVGQGEGWIPSLKGWVAGDRKRKKTSSAVGVICASFIILTAIGFVPLVRKRASVRRLLVVLAASMVGYMASFLMAPHLFIPQRFAVYAVPVFAVLAFPVALAQLGAIMNRSGNRPWLPHASIAVATLACLLLVGGRGGGSAGLTVRIDPEDPLYPAVRQLPKQAVLAGWPSGPMDNIPLVTRRRAFLTEETHQAFSRGFADEARGRMRALIDAYFASSPDGLLALRDQFGVTHLLVDLQHLGDTPPWYFAPFDQWIPPAHEAMRETGSEVLRQLESAEVFRHENMVILDLGRIHARRDEAP